MQNGNWVPLSKALINEFKKINRPFSRIEAAFSLQSDFDNKKEVTVSGYAKLWMWSRKKVRTFLKDMNVDIIYSESTEKLQNQRGQIGGQIRNRQGTDREQIRLIDSTWLNDEGDRQGTDREQIGDRSGDTTIDPIDPKPNPDSKEEKHFNPQKMRPDWIPKQEWEDILEHRKKVKATNSERSLKGNITELKKAIDIGWTVKQCVDEWTARSWRGFKVEWMPKEGPPKVIHSLIKQSLNVSKEMEQYYKDIKDGKAKPIQDFLKDLK